jgi:hypothetical protein
MSWKDWFSVFGSKRPGSVNVACNRCGKEIVGDALGAQNVERCFALNVLRRRIGKFAFDVGVRLKI